MARAERVELIRAIEKKRKSKVVAYVTSDRPGLESSIAADQIAIIERHLRKLGKMPLDLFIYSRGGDGNVPWSLVSMFREHLGSRRFGILIPFRAHSAATVIAIGADQIVMGPMGELGPIDATLNGGPYNPRDTHTNQVLPISVEDVRGYFNLSDIIELNGPEQKSAAFATLASKVHPLALGAVNRTLTQTKKVAEQLLKARLEPLSVSENEAIVKQLSSEIANHAHTIRRKEAVALGIKYVTSAEDEGIDAELWALYEEYVKLFEMTSVFQPNDALVKDENLEEQWYNDRMYACIESTDRLDVARNDLLVKRVREVPPQLSLQMGNVQFALPALPAGIDPNVINQLLVPIVQAQLSPLIDDAVKKLRKSLPQKGFQHVHANFRWQDET